MAERVARIDLLARLLDQFIGSNACPRLCSLLSGLENLPSFCPIKISILQVLAHFSNCTELATSQELILAGSPGVKAVLGKGVEICNSSGVVGAVIKELESPVLEVRIQVLYTIGIFASNHVKLEGFLFGQSGLQSLVNHLSPTQPYQINVLANWCLCLICKNYVANAVISKVLISIVPFFSHVRNSSHVRLQMQRFTRKMNMLFQSQFSLNPFFFPCAQ